MASCPHCGEVTGPYTTLCPHCGRPADGDLSPMKDRWVRDDSGYPERYVGKSTSISDRPKADAPALAEPKDLAQLAEAKRIAREKYWQDWKQREVEDQRRQEESAEKTRKEREEGRIRRAEAIAKQAELHREQERRKLAQGRAFEKANTVLGHSYDFNWRVRTAKWSDGLKDASQLGRVEVIGEIRAWKTGTIEWLILWDPNTDEGRLHKVRSALKNHDEFGR